MNREEIVAYFEIKDKIMPTVKKILNTLSVKLSDIPVEYTIGELHLIKEQVTISLNRQEYDEDKGLIEWAVHFYMEEKICTIREVAEFIRVPYGSLQREISKARDEGMTYCFDRRIIINSNTSLTYKQQYKLALELHYEFMTTAVCHCRICYLLKLSTFASEFVKKYNYPHPHSWDKYADYIWQQKFEMMFYKEIENTYNKKCILY